MVLIMVGALTVTTLVQLTTDNINKEPAHTRRACASVICGLPGMQQTTGHLTAERGHLLEYLHLKDPGLTLESRFCDAIAYGVPQTGRRSKTAHLRCTTLSP